MGVNNDLNLTKVYDQVTPAPLDETERPAVSSSQPADSSAPNVSFLDNPENENVCRPGDDTDDPVDTTKKLHDSLPKLPEVPPNADQSQLQGLQKQLSDYTNMMQMMSNILRMLEDQQKNVMNNLR
jgi:hypothetical protein